MIKWLRAHQALLAWVSGVGLVVFTFWRTDALRDQQVNDLCQTSVEDRLAIRKQTEVLVNASKNSKPDPPLTPEQIKQRDVAIKKFLADSYAAVPLEDCPHKTVEQITKEVEGRAKTRS